MSSSVNVYLIGLRGKLHEIKYNSRYMMIKHICVYILLQLLLSRFRRVQLCVTLWTVAHQAPLSWDSPGKDTGVGGHALLQEIFQTQGLNPGLLHSRQILYHGATREAPYICICMYICICIYSFPFLVLIGIEIL